VKKQQEDFNKIRNDLNFLTKKDGGNLMSKDFTDDIYAKNIDGSFFVPETSEMFANLLVVIPNAKLQEFRQNYCQIIDNFYKEADAKEQGKLEEVSKSKLKHMRENDTEEW
jgi:hypothetical protein